MDTLHMPVPNDRMQILSEIGSRGSEGFPIAKQVDAKDRTAATVNGHRPVLARSTCHPRWMLHGAGSMSLLRRQLAGRQCAVYCTPPFQALMMHATCAQHVESAHCHHITDVTSAICKVRCPGVPV